MNELNSIISIVVTCLIIDFVLFIGFYHTYKYVTLKSLEFHMKIMMLERRHYIRYSKLEYDLLNLESEINDNEVAFTTLYNNKE